MKRLLFAAIAVAVVAYVVDNLREVIRTYADDHDEVKAAYHQGVVAGLMKAIAEIERRRS
jgi:hypothetical protein